MVRLYRTFSKYNFTGEARCAGCLRTSSGWFKVHRTSSNLLEPHHCRDSKVCRDLSHEFGVVRLYRTVSNYIFAGEERCALDHPELVHGKQGVHGSYALVRGGSLLCNDVVRGGSMYLNHPELVHKHPAHLTFPVKM